MARHIDAWMDGVRLSDIGRIVIDTVSEPAPEMEIAYINRQTRGGQGVQKRRRKSLKVTIHAKIFEMYDLQRRNEIRQAIAEWSNGSILELSNHPDQQLHVISKAEPGLGDVREYNSTLDIELEANEIPYWENKIASTTTGTGTTGSGYLYLAGTAQEIPVGVTFTPSGTLTSLTVTVSCGGVTRQIALSGMSVTGAVVFDRDAEDHLTIMNGTTSLLRYRSAASADDLILPHGIAAVSWSANVTGSISFSARGRWA